MALERCTDRRFSFTEPNDKKIRNITFRLPHGLYVKIQKNCLEHKVSMSDYVREVVEQHFKVIK